MTKLAAVVLSLLGLLTGCADQRLPANDWILKQNATCSDLEQASKSISELFSLYFIGAVEPSDFENELDLLIIQLQLSQTQYTESKANIQPATHSYASKSGQESLDSAYSITLNFLKDSANTEQSDLIYPYLEWRDSFISYIATYLTVKSLIIESEEEFNE